MKMFFLYKYASKSGTQGGGKIVLPGRGGAPKFSKNWLPFACSAYAADHIFVPEGHPNPVSGLLLNGFAFNTTLIIAWEQLY